MCKRKLVSIVLVLSMLLAATGIIQAATEAEKQAAIEAGLAWLATQQNPDGSFGPGGTEYYLAQTGSALLAFLEEKDNWVVDYSAVVNNGLNYIFNNASIVPISMQTAGDPDGDAGGTGNGVGVKLFPGGTSSRDTYCTGICLCPIAMTGTPDAVVTVGPLAGWTYKDVVQNVIDYFAFGQSDPSTGAYRGGWRYYANYGQSDQSTSQWPVIAGLFATQMGVSYPDWVGTELDYWVNAIQRADGAAEYVPGFAYGEMNETGALLLMQTFLNYGASDSRVLAAMNYIDQNWLSAPSGFDGNFGNPYAMWAIYKGLQITIGLDDEAYITTNLHPDPGDIDNPNHNYNWWEDYCESLVSNQVLPGGGLGYWTGFNYWNNWLASAWYINILAATEIPPPEIEVPIDIKPTSCPNPLNVGNKGVLPVAIVGTEDFDVTTVDPASVRLVGVAPLRSNLEDVCTPYYPIMGKENAYSCTIGGPDGYLDLTFKFDTQEVVAAIGEVEDRAQIVLTLTGNLKEEFGGTPIIGEDIVIILKKDK